MTASGPHLSSEVTALLDQSKQILLAVGWTFLDLGLRNGVQSLADTVFIMSSFTQKDLSVAS